ncbi:TPA: hypothetical protein ACIPFX_004435 [Salmonella enterica subsp. enterica serovar Birkenhead]|jgi:hypothetical protein
MMTEKEKRPVKNRYWMTAGDIQARDYASCKMARQFRSLLYGVRQKGKTQVNEDV